SRPPVLPDDDALWDIFEQGHQLLTAAGYQQYETSAYAKPGYHLVNVTPSETRVAYIDGGILQEIHIEREARRGIVGNIYKGRVS
ncbi:hypothetical protein MJM83_29440, partial [Salmonella enterica subsp. enterica serovar Montevideo]|nr:hypothetical protein [Salmonella enterica subsp. enterica serovar Montevideo]